MRVLKASTRFTVPLAIAASAVFVTLAMSPRQASGAHNVAVVPAEEAGKEAFIVNKGICWQTSLLEAQAKAKKEGKLVFWMHMLGTMDGAT